ncbi:MAG: hypothetical protein IPO95_04245 [Rhodanobacteraceae bacterium]|nr:hypothetical protein [Rhodanobacteraceae bacterium]MBL0039983.1 hypothetical protein [Xanthomonadales bacterium]
MKLAGALVWFRKTAERIERIDAPFPRFVTLFFALLGIRLCLEFFSSQRLYSSDDVIHIGLWFSFVVLAFMSLLQMATGESMLRTARLAIVCYVFSWSAPIIDLLVHRSIPARMNYIAINSWSDFVQAYLTFGGPSLMRGATLGIRIEIACLVIACFLYVHGKCGSVLRATLAALAIYSMLFATGAIPYLLGLAIGAFGLRYGANDQSTVLLLYCLDAGLLSHVLLRQQPDLWRRVRAQVRLLAVVGAAAAFAYGGRLAHAAYPDNVVLNPTTLFWALMLPWMIVAFVVWLGLVRADDPRTGALRVGLWVVIGAGALLIGDRFAFALQIVFASCWLWQVALSPWRDRPWVAAIGYAVVVLAAALAGFQCFGGPMIGFPPNALWLWPLVAAVLAYAGRMRADATT